MKVRLTVSVYLNVSKMLPFSISILEMDPSVVSNGKLCNLKSQIKLNKNKITRVVIGLPTFINNLALSRSLITSCWCETTLR